jgi:RES domain-containing protein
VATPLRFYPAAFTKKYLALETSNAIQLVAQGFGHLPDQFQKQQLVVGEQASLSLRHPFKA